MNMELHARDITKICEERNMYSTPSLNTVMWLNDLAISRLPPLEAYINVRCLHLENNGLEEIRCMPELPNVQSLFLRV